MTTTTIAINGLGRIGRTLARLLGEGRSPLRLAAINTLEDADTVVALLRRDSVYGHWPRPVAGSGDGLDIGSARGVRLLREPDPAALPWRELGIDIVVESSGRLTRGERAAAHLAAGAKRVVISAAAPGVDATLCAGVNLASYDPGVHRLISASSCTTNCISPALAVIDQAFGIETCLVSFLHSYTNGQCLADGPGADPRRRRAIHGNLIPTSTSAVEQVPLVLPQLAGRIDGLAIRLPTANTHLAVLTLRCATELTANALQATLEDAVDGPLRGILALIRDPVVSCDITGSAASCVIDTATIAVHGRHCRLLIWHDNEYGYCRRLLDLLSHIAHNTF